MKYKSTRGQVNNISFKEAIMMGLAEDGGLIIPEQIPTLSTSDLENMSTMDYQTLAHTVMSYFIDDIDSDDLLKLIEKSYATFKEEDIIPVNDFGNIHIAELFHGPTLAFKDIALQFLGNLFEFILKETGQKMNILGATSGDTGSAAIHGVRGKENINICILHPAGRVSPVQEMQMTTVADKNVYNLAVDGNFDDCQFIVKEIFANLDIKKELQLGAVNSINWARILAQVVYYFYTYFRVQAGTQKINIVVPTGNFGNIFAGIVAKKMGLPIHKLILATNENNILSRFIKDGDYSLKEVVMTHSPSMDIQIASNFERYLYYMMDENSDAVKDLMNELKTAGHITFNDDTLTKVQAELGTISTSNDKTVDTIKSFFNTHRYVLDPHTACGVYAAETFSKETPDEDYICLSTAHPAKFGDVVDKAIEIEAPVPQDVTELYHKEKVMTHIDNSVESVTNFLKQTLV